jgi:hypothetical protein
MPTNAASSHQPQGGNEMPRFAGRATMMRLPFIEDLQGLDAASWHLIATLRLVKEVIHVCS